MWAPSLSLCLCIFNRNNNFFFLAYSSPKFLVLFAPLRTAWPDAQCTATIRERIFSTPVPKNQLFARWWSAVWAVVWTTMLTWSPAWPEDSKRIWSLYSSEEQWLLSVLGTTWDHYTHTHRQQCRVSQLRQFDQLQLKNRGLEHREKTGRVKVKIMWLRVLTSFRSCDFCEFWCCGD